MSEEVSKEFKDMVDRTSQLAKTGNFEEILKMINSLDMDLGNPEMVGAMKMIANGMKAKGDYNKAQKIYQDIYEGLVSRCGMIHKETLNALADVVSTSRDASECFKYLTRGASAAATLGDESVITTFSDLRTSFFDSISPTQKRIYLKLEANRKRKATDNKVSPKQKQAKVDNRDIDEIMKDFEDDNSV